jgi:hypothetical protein
VAGGVEAAAKQECCGDDDGHRACDGGDLREQDCEQQGEQRPESVGGSPELLGEERAVNGDQEDGGNKGLQRGICSELLRAKAPDGERGREDEDMGPEREELAGAVGWIIREREAGDGPEERRGEQKDGEQAGPAVGAAEED